MPIHILYFIQKLGSPTRYRFLEQLLKCLQGLNSANFLLQTAADVPDMAPGAITKLRDDINTLLLEIPEATQVQRVFNIGPLTSTSGNAIDDLFVLRDVSSNVYAALTQALKLAERMATLEPNEVAALRDMEASARELYSNLRRAASIYPGTNIVMPIHFKWRR